MRIARTGRPTAPHGLDADVPVDPRGDDRSGQQQIIWKAGAIVAAQGQRWRQWNCGDGLRKTGEPERGGDQSELRPDVHGLHLAEAPVTGLSRQGVNLAFQLDRVGRRLGLRAESTTL
jgi:hypothetical protein